MAHEINLINARMTWLVVSESFIFSADSVILSASKETSAGRALLWVLPVLGIVLASLVWPSLLAAKNVMHALEDDRGKVDKIIEEVATLGVTSLGPDRKGRLDKTNKVGDMPVELVPPLLAVAWIIVAILQFVT